jgi:hypothetical protein
MICQGVYAVRCQIRIQRSWCTKPTATAEAAAAIYATAVVLSCTVRMAAKKQLSNSSGRSSSKLQDEDRIAK